MTRYQSSPTHSNRYYSSRASANKTKTRDFEKSQIESGYTQFIPSKSSPQTTKKSDDSWSNSSISISSKENKIRSMKTMSTKNAAGSQALTPTISRSHKIPSLTCKKNLHGSNRKYITNNAFGRRLYDTNRAHSKLNCENDDFALSPRNELTSQNQIGYGDVRQVLQCSPSKVTSSRFNHFIPRNLSKTYQNNVSKSKSYANRMRDDHRCYPMHSNTHGGWGPTNDSAAPDQLNRNHKQLTEIPIVQKANTIRFLNLRNNFISDIFNLRYLSNLIFLDLYDNHIEHLHDSMNEITSLRVLLLGKNHIFSIENLDKLVNLDVLDMHSNFITRIEYLQTLTRLRVLNLAGNKIRKIENIRNLIYLEELNLSRNYIEDIDNLREHLSLRRIFLSNNMLNDFNDIRVLSSLSKLTDLSLDGNPLIKRVPKDFSTDDKNEHMQISKLSPVYYRVCAIRSFRSLSRLDLRNVTQEDRHKADRLQLLFNEAREQGKSESIESNNWKQVIRMIENFSEQGYQEEIENFSHLFQFTTESDIDYVDASCHKETICSQGKEEKASIFTAPPHKGYKTIFSSLKCRGKFGCKRGYYELQVPDVNIQTNNNLDSYQNDMILSIYDDAWGLIDWSKVKNCNRLIVHFSSMKSTCIHADTIFQNLPTIRSISFFRNNCITLDQCVHLSSFSSLIKHQLYEINILGEGNNVQNLFLFRELVAYYLPGLKSINGVAISREERDRGKNLFAPLLDDVDKQDKSISWENFQLSLPQPMSLHSLTNKALGCENEKIGTDDLLGDKGDNEDHGDKTNKQKIEFKSDLLPTFCTLSDEQCNDLDPLAFEALAIQQASSDFEDIWPSVMKLILENTLDIYHNLDSFMEQSLTLHNSKLNE